MIQILEAYWPIILVALLIGLVVGFLAFRPRQRVRFSDSTPVRPHMAEPSREPGSGAQPVPGPDNAARASGPANELERLKGVGPKLAAMLNAHGLTSFEQIANLSDREVERIDADLGAFRGRLQRDRIVEQAEYLAKGDVDGFEQRFGKL